MTRHDRVSYRHGRVSLTAPQYKRDFIRKSEEISELGFGAAKEKKEKLVLEAQGNSISSRGFDPLTSLVVIFSLICIMCIWFMILDL